MGKTRSTIRKKKYDHAAYNWNKINLWSDLTHDVLSLIMMKLEVVDFLAFSIVCKSWRSHAISNRNTFIVSKPPLSIRISTNANTCFLTDFEGRKFKITLPHSTGRTCVGSTCGYFILCGLKSKDFWLVNPITRHELHFPGIPFDDIHDDGYFRAILVFSPSVSRWVFVISDPFSPKIWFSVAGERKWTHVPTRFRIRDLHAFKGKIYALHLRSRLSEVRLYPTPTVTFLEIKNFPKPGIHHPVLVSWAENLYLWDILSPQRHKIYEIDIGEMKYMSCENTVAEYAFFCSCLKYGVSCTDLQSKYRTRFADIDYIRGKWKFSYEKMWYFFHDCLNVNILHE